MRIDLHVHTQERSGCGKSPELAMIEAAIAAGLDAVVLTDHDRLAPPERLAELNARFAPFRVFGGVEVTVLEGEHISVLGVDDPALERLDWDYPALHGFVRSRGGFLIVNHPFRYVPTVRVDLEGYPPDAIEGYSHNTPLASEGEILALAGSLGLRVLSNSDAHHVDRLGAYYNVLQTDPPSDAALVAALRSGPIALARPNGFGARPLT